MCPLVESGREQRGKRGTTGNLRLGYSHKWWREVRRGTSVGFTGDRGKGLGRLASSVLIQSWV